MTPAWIETLDAADPLAPLRREFLLPDGLIYLDGNSLGPLPRRTPEILRRVVEEEWGDDLISSWADNDWIGLPQRVGDKIARLIGARPGEVVAADSVSVNLFKLLAAALSLRPDRRKILFEAESFPTDLYMAEGLVDLLSRGRDGSAAAYRLQRCSHEKILDEVDEDTAVVCLNHIHYRTGYLHDLAQMTAAAREHGALVLWDLAHSAGTMPLGLNDAGVELAVGCGYKFLNGGPGCPGFLYLAKPLQEAARQPLQGWMGHADPFAFEGSYRPSADLSRFLCGTPPILGLVALEAGCDLVLKADLGQARRKARRLGDLFLDLVDGLDPALGLEVACPRDADRRGSQVCLRHPHAHAVMPELIRRGVVGDFRPPDILRFGLSPLVLRYRDISRAVEVLEAVVRAQVPPE